MLNIVARRHNAATVRWLRLSTRSIIRRSCGLKSAGYHDPPAWTRFRRPVPHLFLPAKQAHYRFGSPLAQRLLAERKRRRLKIAN